MFGSEQRHAEQHQLLKTLACDLCAMREGIIDGHAIRRALRVDSAWICADLVDVMCMFSADSVQTQCRFGVARLAIVDEISPLVAKARRIVE